MAKGKEIETSGTKNTSGSGSQIGSASTPTNVDKQAETLSLPQPQVLPQGSSSPSETSGHKEVLKRKPSRPPSDAWNHFIREKDRAIRNYCKKSYACNASSHGTTNLLKHLKNCERNPNRQVDKRQKTIVFGKQCEDDPNTMVSMKLADFNQDRCRLALAKMIIMDELPFRFVEGEGFRGFMSEAQPRFKIPSRITIARDCMELFRQEKDKLKSILCTNRQMVSFTTDTWTSIQNLNYMCVTAHYIDDNWELNKKILSFGLIADHRGETIGKTLEKILKDWGILRICCVTVDNASANSLAIAHLALGISNWNGITLLNGEYMHMRCCAHILNLIVNEGLKDMDDSVCKIRTACKYVKSSPARLATFKRCVEETNIASKAMLTLDVPTRWNSTYKMLDVAEKFQKAFTCLDRYDNHYMIACETACGPHSDDDWKRARVFMKFLKVFYDATLAFSGSLFVTSNTFFRELCEIHKTIYKWRQSKDSGLQQMASSMKVKFDKYWEIDGNINYLLFVAAFLDPRYKLDYIEFCFKRIYGDDICKQMVNKLKDLISKLMEQYTELNQSSLDNANSSSFTSSATSHMRRQDNNEDKSDDDWEDEFRLKLMRKQENVKKDELERYMEDDHVEDSRDFDIIKWWKGKRGKYHVLSCMARDILAIPVSTVSSESAFSTGGRVLDPFRSSLHPTTVEALVCTQNWLRSPTKEIDLRGILNEVEKIEAELEELN